MKFAVFGDRHLSARLPRYKESLRLWDWAIDDAIQKYHVDGFLGTGDVCEAGITLPNEVLQMCQRYSLMQQYGWVAEIEGNHEQRGGMQWLRYLACMSIWDEIVVSPFPECVLVMFPYCRRGYSPYLVSPMLSFQDAYAEVNAQMASKLAQVRADYPDRPIIVAGHWTVEGMTIGPSDFELTGGEELIVKQETLREAALTLTGHVHNAQQLGTPGHGWVMGVGSLHRVTFAEWLQQKSYCIVTVENGEVDCVRRFVPAREMTDKTISGEHVQETVAYMMTQTEPRDVKLKIEVSRDDTRNFDSILAPLKTLPGHYTWEIVREQVVRTRAPELAKPEKLNKEFDTWCRVTGREIDPTDRLELEQMLSAMESE